MLTVIKMFAVEEEEEAVYTTIDSEVDTEHAVVVVDE